MASQLKSSRVFGKRSVLALGFLLAGSTVAACGSSADVADESGVGTGGKNGTGSSNGTGGLVLGSGGGNSGSGSSSSSGGGSNSSGGSAQGGATYGGDVDYPDDITFDYDMGEGGSTSCASVTGTPQGVSRPIDIIFVIDNSGSMSDEIQEVEENIYDNFATIIQNATVGGNPIDYRVIMISRYGDSATNGISGSDTNFGVCIPSPFGVQKSTGPNFDNNCSNPLMTPLRNPADQPADRRFFHYSADIESRDALCAVLESYDSPDEFNDSSTTDDGPTGSAYRNWIKQAPNGWQAWLRPDAFKTFVVITDDRIACNRNEFGGPNLALDDGSDGSAQTAAANFDSALLALSASQFGTAAARNYIFHSIIGLNEKTNVDEPYQSDEPINTQECGDGSNVDAVSRGYQYLSKLTGGLRFPLCRPSFDPIFDAIAQGVIDTAEVPCQYDFPTVNGIINPNNIKMTFKPGAGADQSFAKVANVGACTSGNQYYFDDNANPTKLFLCEDACTTVQADDAGSLELDFGCLGS
jgi:hypothetical protein